jgi:CRP-like cAMP-binding protein
MNADFFETIQLISPIRDEAKEALLAVTKTVKHAKGEFLLEEGKVCNYLYFVERGCLRGYYNLDGKEVTYWFSTEGMFATSFYSFISRKPSYETIRVLEDSSLIAIHFDDLTNLYKGFHEIETLGRLVNERYYLQLEERTYALQFLSAKERYEKMLSNNPTWLQRISLGFLASYLGITQETLSRIRGKF